MFGADVLKECYISEVGQHILQTAAVPFVSYSLSFAISTAK